MTKNQKAMQKFELDTDSTYTSHKMIIILIITTNYSDISTRELFFANLDIFHNFLLATARDKVLSTWWAELSVVTRESYSWDMTFLLLSASSRVI